MSSQSGFIVFTATPEMAQQTKVFKSGVTYVAQRAVAVAQTGSAPASAVKAGGRKKTSSRKASTKSATTKKAARKTTAKKATTKKVTKKAAASKPAKASKREKAATAKRPLKSTARKTDKPEIIVQYVRANEGCNMTDIERSTKLPQAAIRRILNTARDAGAVRTEGQRRGLRYFAGAATAGAAGGNADMPEGGW